MVRKLDKLLESEDSSFQLLKEDVAEAVPTLASPSRSMIAKRRNLHESILDAMSLWLTLGIDRLVNRIQFKPVDVMNPETFRITPTVAR